MNNIAKLSIGLATTGTAVAGAFLANNLLNKGEEKSRIDAESSEVDSEALAIQWEKRNESRVSTLTSIFNGATSEKRREMAKIIWGRDIYNPIFDINDSGRFHIDDDVASALNVWCNRDESDGGAKWKQYSNIEKIKICESE